MLGRQVGVGQRVPDLLGGALDVCHVHEARFVGHVWLLCSPSYGSQRLKARALELVDPPFLHLVDGHGVEVVELLPASPQRGHEVGAFEDVEVLGR